MSSSQTPRKGVIKGTGPRIAPPPPVGSAQARQRESEAFAEQT